MSTLAETPSSTSIATEQEDVNKKTIKSFTNASLYNNGSNIPELQQPEVPLPDGGFAAWLTLIGAFLVVFCSSGYDSSFGVYEDYYVRVYLSNYSSSQINWIGGVQTFFLFSIGIFSGHAMDNGLFRHVMFSGSILFVFCLFMVSLSKPQQWYQLFLAQGIGLGIAIGTIYVPAISILAHHFKQRRSLAMGIVVSASSLGGVVHPIMLNNLIYSSLGFKWAIRCRVFFNFALLLIANVCMTSRIPPRVHKNKKKMSDQIASYKHFMKDKSYIAATAGIFLVISGVYFPIFSIQLDAIEHGVDQSLSFYTLAILNGSSALGRVLPTLIADRIGIFKLVVPCTVICGALIFAMAITINASRSVILAVLYGLFSGACVSLLAPMLANLSKDITVVGARLGLSFGIGGFGALIAPPITGALLTTKFIWIRPIIFCGLCMFSGAACLALAGVLFSRQQCRDEIEEI